MKEKIRAELANIVINQKINILYACESGSRAWGFPSRDSDYDVRFIFSRPLSDYLSLEEKPDTIEIPITDGLDFSGWDIKKALKLLRKTNPPLLEWLGSPIVYTEHKPLMNEMRELSRKYYSPKACLYHYFHMARNNVREYLQGDIVWVKKYLYVLRPLFAMRYMSMKNMPVPTDFNVMLNELPMRPEFKKEIQKLIERKRQGDELYMEHKIEIIDNFIKGDIAYWMDNLPKIYQQPKDIEELNVFFRKVVDLGK